MSFKLIHSYRLDLNMCHFPSIGTIEDKCEHVISKYLSSFEEYDLRYLRADDIINSIPSNEYHDKLIMNFTINKYLHKYLMK